MAWNGRRGRADGTEIRQILRRTTAGIVYMAQACTRLGLWGLDPCLTSWGATPNEMIQPHRRDTDGVVPTPAQARQGTDTALSRPATANNMATTEQSLASKWSSTTTPARGRAPPYILQSQYASRDRNISLSPWVPMGRADVNNSQHCLLTVSEVDQARKPVERTFSPVQPRPFRLCPQSHAKSAVYEQCPPTTRRSTRSR